MVYLFLADGFEEAEALVPVDLLRRAGIETSTVSMNPDLTVTGGHGIRVWADIPFAAVTLESADMLVLPGGTVGVANLEKSSGLKELLESAAAEGIPVCAICAAPAMLARWGILDGRDFVCYPGLEKGITSARPHPDRSTVEDGTFTTGRAAGSAFDFGLRLVARLAGEEKAASVAAGIFYQR